MPNPPHQRARWLHSLEREAKLLPGRLKRLPRWTRVTAVVVALAILALLVAPYFLDVDRYRTLIGVTIENQTGRRASMTRIRARLFPGVGFVVEGFRLGNPAGFGGGDVLAVEKIKVRLAFWPLLRKDFQLSSMELVRPKLVLLENDQGQTNYENFSAPRPVNAPQGGHVSESVGAQLTQIDTVELSDLEVTVGRISPRGEVLPSLRAEKVNATLVHVMLSPMQPKLWEGESKLGGVLFALPGWKDPVKFSSGHVGLRGGRLDAEFRAAMGKAADFTGTVHVADVERGVATFDLRAAQLDVDQLLPSQRKTAYPVRAARPLRSELVAQGHLSAQHLRWAPYMGNNATADVRIFNDRVELWPMQVETYGGVLQISARSDRTQEPERFSTNVQVRNLDVGRMLSASPEMKGKMSGTAELNLQVFGSLSEQWQRTLTGSGHFSIRDGRLPRLNLSGAAETLAKIASAGGDTPFRVIEGDLSVGGGRVASRSIHMDSPVAVIDLHGSSGLNGTLDYDGQAVLSPGLGGGSPAQAIGAILGGVLQQNVSRVTVPFSLRGTFNDPKVLPGRGVPNFQTSQPASPLQSPQKKSILDIFRKP